jgi:hypothetical protein
MSEAQYGVWCDGGCLNNGGRAAQAYASYCEVQRNSGKEWGSSVTQEKVHFGLSACISRVWISRGVEVSAPQPGNHHTLEAESRQSREAERRTHSRNSASISGSRVWPRVRPASSRIVP